MMTKSAANPSGLLKFRKKGYFSSGALLIYNPETVGPGPEIENKRQSLLRTKLISMLVVTVFCVLKSCCRYLSLGWCNSIAGNEAQKNSGWQTRPGKDEMQRGRMRMSESHCLPI